MGAGMALVLGGAYVAHVAARAGADRGGSTQSATTASGAVSRTAAPAEAGGSLTGHDKASRGHLVAAVSTELGGSKRVDATSALGSAAAARPFVSRVGSLDQSRALDCLATAVYYEARGEGQAGMEAVAQVVLNRVRHPSFPKSVCGVVYQGCQFSFTCNGAMRGARQREVWARSRNIAERALGGYVYTPVGTATHFHTNYVNPRWGGLTRIGQVGTHIFYKIGGAGGSPQAFSRSYRGGESVGRAHQPVEQRNYRRVERAFGEGSQRFAAAAQAAVQAAVGGSAHAATPAPAKPTLPAGPPPIVEARPLWVPVLKTAVAPSVPQPQVVAQESAPAAEPPATPLAQPEPGAAPAPVAEPASEQAA